MIENGTNAVCKSRECSPPLHPYLSMLHNVTKRKMFSMIPTPDNVSIKAWIPQFTYFLHLRRRGKAGLNDMGLRINIYERCFHVSNPLALRNKRARIRMIYLWFPRGSIVNVLREVIFTSCTSRLTCSTRTCGPPVPPGGDKGIRLYILDTH